MLPAELFCACRLAEVSSFQGEIQAVISDEVTRHGERSVTLKAPEFDLWPEDAYMAKHGKSFAEAGLKPVTVCGQHGVLLEATEVMTPKGCFRVVYSDASRVQRTQVIMNGQNALFDTEHQDVFASAASAIFPLNSGGPPIAVGNGSTFAALGSNDQLDHRSFFGINAAMDDEEDAGVVPGTDDDPSKGKSRGKAKAKAVANAKATNPAPKAKGKAKAKANATPPAEQVALEHGDVPTPRPGRKSATQAGNEPAPKKPRGSKGPVNIDDELAKAPTNFNCCIISLM